MNTFIRVFSIILWLFLMMWKWVLLIGFFLMVAGLSAQTEGDNDLKLSTLPYYSYGKGLGLTSPDSVFQFNIRFRMQNRFGYLEGDNTDPRFDGQIRRLRLRFDGFVGDPTFLYVIQLSFAPGDVGEVIEGDNINIIRDAIVFYRPNKNWNFGFGQTKLPGNRQRVNSSGALQLTDRTINNARFNIDRDFGFHVNYLNEDKDKFSYNIKTALSMGDGRNWTRQPDDGLAYTAKVEIFPMGALPRDGSLFEGDITRSQTPKVMISAAYHYNNNARREAGVLGKELFERRNLKSILLDGMFKYRGFAFMTAYMSRSTIDPITINSLGQQRAVFVGEGMDFQGSYLFRNQIEVISRYSFVHPNSEIESLFARQRQISLGLTKYVWEHAFKIQGEINRDFFEAFDGGKTSEWYVRFQIEMGI